MSIISNEQKYHRFVTNRYSGSTAADQTNQKRGCHDSEK